jgi:photosystem II stability/assembly factor-like uncharacterized protein
MNRMMKNTLLSVLVLGGIMGYAQPVKNKLNPIPGTENKQLIKQSETFSSLRFRSIGPSLVSGRIADIAVNPANKSQWYLAVASGGVWKTDNAGTTFTPIFDNQGSYSIGCISIDPNNEHTIWVGTGENNNQRSVAYGDGVYKSEDGGQSWENVGLKNSEHIGMIAIHPNNSQVVFVAAYGPLWSKGGDRGVYKTTDGGVTWKQVLHVSENTGCNEVHFDPNNPSVLYASFHQRRRQEWTYLSGGPESGIYKSIDGGDTWHKLTKGLPSGDVGRIGLTISPVSSDYIYAIIEGSEADRGFYKSTNRGASWEKQSVHSTSGNYYSEIIADPINRDKVYSMDTYAQVTLDGGKTFNKVGEKFKHVDNHALWIDPLNTQHMLMGCDGGLYETWDNCKTWNFKSNLPITQFYRVAVDNAFPFYAIYGGTQDNNTLGGPSRTRSASGIVNADWFITVGGDGFTAAIDPTDPNIVYSQWQYGGLVRFDRKNGNRVDIKPKERKGEESYRFNWDAPFIISTFKPERIYFAAQKVFRSDDRGNTWQVISPDLTAGIDRNKLPIMDRYWGMDGIAINASTSIYGNITALSESPKNEQLLYVGTDDGLIQVTINGGQSWNKIEKFSGVPKQVLVHQIKASKHDENVAYAVFNNHRSGDFKPYVVKTIDKGKTWIEIGKGLPERGSVYTIAEDHKNKQLLFVGTEFGVFFTLDGGQNWLQLKGGLPTICVRDIAIQERENDLVLGTFGRGFYVLDDYSPLQTVCQEDLDKKAHIFPIKNGLVFIEEEPLGEAGKGSLGDSYYTASNPLMGATFTFYIKDDYLSIKEKRVAAEKEKRKNNQPLFFPGADSIRLEDNEEAPYVLAVINDEKNNVVRILQQPAKKGLYRINWSGRMTETSPIYLSEKSSNQEYGPIALPGNYSVQLVVVHNGRVEELTKKTPFKLTTLNEYTLPNDQLELHQFYADLGELRRLVLGVSSYFSELETRNKYLKVALLAAGGGQLQWLNMLKENEQSIAEIRILLKGDESLAKREFATKDGFVGRIENMVWNTYTTQLNATTTHRQELKEVTHEFEECYTKVKNLKEAIENLEAEYDQYKMPYTPGRLPDWRN